MQPYNLDISSLKPIRDIVYDSLRTSILQGELKPGERIVEKEYADKYSISRTPVREALRKLEIEGIVEYIPRKGVIVKSYDRNEIAEIYSIRMALEELAVKAAIENITEEEITGLRRLIAEMGEFEAADRMDKLEEACGRFNEIVIAAAKMPRLTDTVNSLKDHLQRFRRITLSQELRRGRAILEHQAILQAVMERDKEKAARLVNHHLEGARQTLLQNLDME